MFCQPVKYKEIYLNDYVTVSDARDVLDKHFSFDNMERLHESIGYKSPYDIYFREKLIINPVKISTAHLN
jgi:putative transposase